MLLAPVAGLLLGLSAGAVLLGARAALAPGALLLPAVLAVAALALLTRGLHLDGLADTVDALGSYRRGAEALAVARSGDTGPLGVAAVVLVLLAQAAALSAASGSARSAAVAVVTAVVSGRTALAVSCRRGVPVGAGSRLGAVVVGTVPRAAALGAVAAVSVLAAAAGALLPGEGSALAAGVRGAAAPFVAAAVAVLLGGHCVRRFGGLTGDVLGAGVELGTTAALLVLAVRP